MGAALDDLSLLHDENLIGLSDGAEAVGDDKTGAIAAIGGILVISGLVVLSIWGVVLGYGLVTLGKLWYLDRMAVWGDERREFQSIEAGYTNAVAVEQSACTLLPLVCLASPNFIERDLPPMMLPLVTDH